MALQTDIGTIRIFGSILAFAAFIYGQITGQRNSVTSIIVLIDEVSLKTEGFYGPEIRGIITVFVLFTERTLYGYEEVQDGFFVFVTLIVRIKLLVVVCVTLSSVLVDVKIFDPDSLLILSLLVDFTSDVLIDFVAFEIALVSTLLLETTSFSATVVS